jgi:hypothetical protein
MLNIFKQSKKAIAMKEFAGKCVKMIGDWIHDLARSLGPFSGLVVLFFDNPDYTCKEMVKLPGMKIPDIRSKDLIEEAENLKANRIIILRFYDTEQKPYPKDEVLDSIDHLILLSRLLHDKGIELCDCHLIDEKARQKNLVNNGTFTSVSLGDVQATLMLKNFLSEMSSGGFPGKVSPQDN